MTESKSTCMPRRTSSKFVVADIYNFAQGDPTAPTAQQSPRAYDLCSVSAMPYVLLWPCVRDVRNLRGSTRRIVFRHVSRALTGNAQLRGL